MHDRHALTPLATTRAEPGSAGLAEKVATLLLCSFAAELILGGPGYWFVSGVSIRKTLFILSFVWFACMWCSGRIRLSLWAVITSLLLVMFMLLWIVLIPVLRRPAQLSLAVQDGLPLAVALLGVLCFGFYERHPRAWRQLCRTVSVCLCAVAVFNIVVWAVGMTGTEGYIAANAGTLFLFTLGQLELAPPLFVGPMPDGFFRAFWITGTLYMPALLYCIAARRSAGVWLFSLALLVTYTRSLWLVAVLGILIAHWLSPRGAPFVRGRTTGTILAIAAMGAAMTLLFSSADGTNPLSIVSERVGSTFTDSSAEERFNQAGPLVDQWLNSPLVGSGFGASAKLVRSDDAPFSYELTFLALLMKVGLIGLAAVVIPISAMWLAAVLQSGQRSRTRVAGLASIVAFLVAGSTNPYLTNFVGMSALSFMFIKLFMDDQSRRGAGNSISRQNAPAAKPQLARSDA